MAVERPGQLPAVLGGNGVAIRSSPRLNAFQMEKTKAKSRSDRGGLQFPITETPYDKFYYTLRVRLQDGWDVRALALLQGSRLEELDVDRPGTCWVALPAGGGISDTASPRRLRVLAERREGGASGCLELDVRLQELDKVASAVNTRALLPDRKRDPVRLALVFVHADSGEEHWALSAGFLLKTKWGTQKGASIRHEELAAMSSTPTFPPTAAGAGVKDDTELRKPRRSRTRAPTTQQNRKRKHRDPAPEEQQFPANKAARHVSLPCGSGAAGVAPIPVEWGPQRIVSVIVPTSPTPVDKDLPHHFDFNFKDDPLFSDLICAQAWVPAALAQAPADTKAASSAGLFGCGAGAVPLEALGEPQGSAVEEWVDLSGDNPSRGGGGGGDGGGGGGGSAPNGLPPHHFWGLAKPEPRSGDGGPLELLQAPYVPSVKSEQHHHSEEVKPVIPALARGYKLGSPGRDGLDLKLARTSSLESTSDGGGMDWTTVRPKSEHTWDAKPPLETLLWFDPLLADGDEHLGGGAEGFKCFVDPPRLDHDTDDQDVKPIVHHHQCGSSLLPPAIIQSLLDRSMSLGSDPAYDPGFA